MAGGKENCQGALPEPKEAAIILGFPECVQGDLTGAPLFLPQRSVHTALQLQLPGTGLRGFKSSSPELNLKE